MASLTTIVTGITAVSGWFWGIFSDFIDMITANDLLLWSVAFAIVAGVTYMAIRVVRKFGLRGR